MKLKLLIAAIMLMIMAPLQTQAKMPAFPVFGEPQPEPVSPPAGFLPAEEAEGLFETSSDGLPIPQTAWNQPVEAKMGSGWSRTTVTNTQVQYSGAGVGCAGLGGGQGLLRRVLQFRPLRAFRGRLRANRGYRAGGGC